MHITSCMLVAPTHWTLYSIQWISNSGITHSILQFTECLYHGHSTPALRTRVRAAALVSNDPGFGSPRRGRVKFLAFFTRASSFAGLQFMEDLPAQRVPTFSNSKNYCTIDISDEISRIPILTIYIIIVIVVKLLLRKRIRSNFHEMFKSRFNFNFRYLKDYRIDLIDPLESHPSTIGTRRIFDSKSEKSLFPFLPLCEYRLQFVSRIFGSKHRSLAKLGSIGDEMGKFARRPPRAK